MSFFGLFNNKTKSAPKQPKGLELKVLRPCVCGNDTFKIINASSSFVSCWRCGALYDTYECENPVALIENWKD